MARLDVYGLHQRETAGLPGLSSPPCLNLLLRRGLIYLLFNVNYLLSSVLPVCLQSNLSLSQCSEARLTNSQNRRGVTERLCQRL